MTGLENFSKRLMRKYVDVNASTIPNLSLLFPTSYIPTLQYKWQFWTTTRIKFSRISSYIGFTFGDLLLLEIEHNSMF